MHAGGGKPGGILSLAHGRSAGVAVVYIKSRGAGADRVEFDPDRSKLIRGGPGNVLDVVVQKGRAVSLGESKVGEVRLAKPPAINILSHSPGRLAYLELHLVVGDGSTGPREGDWLAI